MNVALALVGVSVLGGAVAALLFSLRIIGRMQAEDLDDKKTRARLAVAEKDLTYWTDRASSLTLLVEEKAHEVERETAARRKVETHRDELLRALLQTNDPPAIAKTIQNELANLRTIK